MKLDPLIRFLSREHRTVPNGLYNRRSGYKKYNRFPIVELAEPDQVNVLLEEVLQERSSARDFSGVPITNKELSSLLFWSAGDLKSSVENRPPKRSHPSGGALYPIEIYLLILNSTDIMSAVYHYNIKKHALEEMFPVDLNVALNTFVTQQDMVRSASAVLLFSFVKSRSMENYRELAYKTAFLEGGHIGQNIQLVSTALGLGACPLGAGMDALNEQLRLDGINEFIFYGMCIGHTLDKESS